MPCRLLFDSLSTPVSGSIVKAILSFPETMLYLQGLIHIVIVDRSFFGFFCGCSCSCCLSSSRLCLKNLYNRVLRIEPIISQLWWWLVGSLSWKTTPEEQVSTLRSKANVLQTLESLTLSLRSKIVVAKMKFSPCVSLLSSEDYKGRSCFLVLPQLKKKKKN